MKARRRKGQSHWCTGVALVTYDRMVEIKTGPQNQGTVNVRRCHEAATVIAQVRLPEGMRAFCDECLKRYRKAHAVIRVLVDLKHPHREIADDECGD